MYDRARWEKGVSTCFHVAMTQTRYALKYIYTVKNAFFSFALLSLSLLRCAPIGPFCTELAQKEEQLLLINDVLFAFEILTESSKLPSHGELLL